MAGGRTGRWRKYSFPCDLGRGEGYTEFKRGHAQGRVGAVDVSRKGMYGELQVL